MARWKDYQAEAAAFFRSIGLDAETDVRLDGVRSSHDVDVVVRSQQAGFDLLWVVECKRWKARVKKLHVHGLLDIIGDIGADRGILLSESGFQSGAVNAARLTNVHLTSLSDLADTARYEIGMAQLQALRKRVASCRERYWDLEKRVRIEYGLRPEAPDFGYSGDIVIQAVEAALNAAAREEFPLRYNELVAVVHPEICIPANTPRELVAVLEPPLADLERRLGVAEAAVRDRS